MVGVKRQRGTVWAGTVYMQDLSEALIGEDERLDRSRRLQTVLHGLADLHESFRGELVPRPLLPLRPYPAPVAAHRAARMGGTPTGELCSAVAGRRSSTSSPPTWPDPILALAEDPSPLVAGAEDVRADADLR